MAFNNYGNRFQRTTPVVLNLIIINALVYLIQYLFDGPQSDNVLDQKITREDCTFPIPNILF